MTERMSAAEYRFTIPGPPVAKQRPRTVWHDAKGNRLAKPRTFTPTKTVKAEEAITWAALAAGVKLEPKRAYGIEILFYLSSHRKDIDNLSKTVLDGLQRMGSDWNDRQVTSLNARVVSVRDGGDERTDVVIRDLGVME